MKLSQYVRQCGSVEKAANKIGCTTLTLWNTYHGKTKPGALLLSAMERVKITEVDTVEVKK